MRWGRVSTQGHPGPLAQREGGAIPFGQSLSTLPAQPVTTGPFLLSSSSSGKLAAPPLLLEALLLAFGTLYTPGSLLGPLLPPLSFAIGPPEAPRSTFHPQASPWPLPAVLPGAALPECAQALDGLQASPGRPPCSRSASSCSSPASWWLVHSPTTVPHHPRPRHKGDPVHLIHCRLWSLEQAGLWCGPGDLGE